MRRLTLLFLFPIALAVSAQEPPAQQPPAPAPAAVPKKIDNYAGTVVEFSKDKVVVAKTKESRTFRITPDTKIEGKLKAKVRVTVRFTSDETGDTATRIIVRTTMFKPK